MPLYDYRVAFARRDKELLRWNGFGANELRLTSVLDRQSVTYTLAEETVGCDQLGTQWLTLQPQKKRKFQFDLVQSAEGMSLESPRMRFPIPNLDMVRLIGMIELSPGDAEHAQPGRPRAAGWHGRVFSDPVLVASAAARDIRCVRPTGPVGELYQQIESGTPEEKQVALLDFMTNQQFVLVPVVLHALLDDTVLPGEGDAGWGTVNHLAATAMCKFAQSHDGKTQRERGYDLYSFHNSGGVADMTARNQIFNNWDLWWHANMEEVARAAK